jgi:hypothetical protein
MLARIFESEDDVVDVSGSAGGLENVEAAAILLIKLLELMSSRNLLQAEII